MTNQQIINPADLEAWGDEFRRRAERTTAAMWDFIDFMGDGYRAYGDEIYNHVDEQYYALGTLRNMVTTALNFPLSRRVNLPRLSPAHYQVVNSIKDHELQAAALRLAADKGLTRNELRAECKRLGLISDKDALELALEVHALSAELHNANGKLASLQAQIDATPLPFIAPYPVSYNGTARADTSLADSVGTVYPRGDDDHEEWATGRAACQHCGQPLTCAKCGGVQG